MTLPFAEQLEHLPESPEWLAELRRQAATRYRETGLPTPRDESWKYTNLAPLLSTLSSRGLTTGSSLSEKAALDPAIKSRDDNFVVPEPLVPGGAQAVFLNGIFKPELSTLGDLPMHVIAFNMASDHINENYVGGFGLEQKPLGALNTALFKDGLRIVFDLETRYEQPLEVCFIGHGFNNWHARLGISVNFKGTGTVIERHIGTGAFVGTVVSEIQVDDEATLRHYRLQQTGPEAVILATSGIEVDHRSLYDAFSLISGGRLSRHEIIASLPCHDAEIRLNGAHVLSGASHADTTTEIRHMAPHCRSRETYRHVMDGTSRSVFQGKIFVAEGAQKTDGFQLNQSLMLSPTAEVNAKPELEIYADDVKCSHGATSGRLDAEALFYLRSRGIPEAQARAMLIEAFIGSSIDLIEDEAVREAFRRHASEALADKGEKR